MKLGLSLLLVTCSLVTKLAFGLGGSGLGTFDLLAKKDAIICSNTWSNLAQTCPIDIPTYLRNKHPIGVTRICFHRGCDDSGNTLPLTTIYTILNADTGESRKYKVVKRNNIHATQANGRVNVTRGYVRITEEPTLSKEQEAAQLLYSAHQDYKFFARSMQLTQTNNGVIDKNGNSPQRFEHYTENCHTMLDYAYHNNGCTGALNKAIDLGVKDDVTFHAMISALRKTKSILDVIIPRLDRLDLTEFSKFPIRIHNQDGSVTVINVQVDNGSVRIKIDAEASRTASNLTLDQLSNAENAHNILGSLKEAQAFALRGKAGQQCNQAYLRSKRAVKVGSEVTPEGLRVIYKIENVFLVYTRCTYNN